MFYETSKIIGEDIPRVFYTQIQTYPFEEAKCFNNREELEAELSKHFSKLLKTKIEVAQLNSNSNSSCMTFNLFFNDLLIMKNCTGFIELAPLRDAIFYIRKYEIQKYCEYFDPDTVMVMMKIQVGKTYYTVRKTDYINASGRSTQNLVLLNDQIIQKLADAVGKRFKMFGY